MGEKATDSGHLKPNVSGDILSDSLLHSAGISLDLIADKLFELVYIRDLEGVITYIGPQVSRYGYLPTDLVGHNVREFVHPDDLVLVRGKGATEQTRCYRLRSKDGAYVHLEVNTIPLLKNNQVEGYVGLIRDITGRKKAEEILRESEERYKSIVENSRDAIMLTNPDGKIAYLSPACKSVLGYEQKDLLGKQPWITYEEDLAKVKELHAKALNGQSGAFDYRIITKNKEIKWVSHSWSPVFRDKKLHLIVSMVKDITDQKQAEEELSESYELFRSTLSSMDDAVIITGKTGLLLGYQKPPDWENFLNLASGIGRHYEAVLPKDLSRRLKSAFEAANATGKVQQFEHRLLTGDRMGWFSVKVSSRTDSKGKISGFTIVSRNITAQKNAQVMITAERDRAQNYLDIAEVMLVAIDAKGKVSLINKKGCEILGYREEEITGKNWFMQFLPARERKETYRVFRKLMLGKLKHTEYTENFVLLKGGNERLVAWHNALVRDSSNRIVGTLSSGEDVTEKRRTEGALRESEERFRSIVKSMDDSLMMVDRNGVMAYYNKPLSHRVPVKPEEFIGIGIDKALQKFASFISGETAKRFRSGFFELRETGKAQSFDFPIKTNEGERLYNAKITKRAGASGEFVGATIVMRDITHRKEIEDKLRESEARYRALFDNAPVALLEEDLSRVKKHIDSIRANGKKPERILEDRTEIEKLMGMVRHIELNKSALEVYGARNRKDFLANISRIMDDAPQGELASTFKALLSGQKRFESESSFISLNGQKRHVKMTCFVPPGFEDSLGSALLSIVDITERKRAEQKLERSENRYRSLVNSLNEGIWVLDKDSYTIFANPKMAGMLGYSVKEMMGEHLFSFMDGKHAEIAKKHIEKRKGGESEQSEFEFLKKDGSRMQALVATSPIFDENGDYAGTVAGVMGITERKRAEQELAKSERKFRLLAELCPAGIYLTDENGRCVYANGRWCEMAGLSAEKAKGDGWLSGIHPADRTKVKRLWKRMVNSNGRWGFKYRFLNKEKKATTVFGTTSPIRTEGGELLGYVGLNTELPEREDEGNSRRKPKTTKKSPRSRKKKR